MSWIFPVIHECNDALEFDAVLVVCDGDKKSQKLGSNLMFIVPTIGSATMLVGLVFFFFFLCFSTFPLTFLINISYILERQVRIHNLPGTG